MARFIIFCFFFQAEDGIRDDLVTGVQTCALPISELLDITTNPPVTAVPLAYAEEPILAKMPSTKFPYIKQKTFIIMTIHGSAFEGNNAIHCSLQEYRSSQNSLTILFCIMSCSPILLFWTFSIPK